MAAAFAGRWKTMKIDGAEDYFTAIGHADMAKDMYNITEVEVLVEDKTITTTTRIEGKDPMTDVAVLDETTEKEGPGGIKISSKSYIDGDVFRQEGTSGGEEWRVARHVKDGACVTQITRKGKTLTITMVKI